MNEVLIRGRVLTFLAEPQGIADTASYRYIEDGAVHVRDGKIVDIGLYNDIRKLADAGTRIADHRPNLILPGFIDTHLHFPQTQAIASYGAQLLDWFEVARADLLNTFRNLDPRARLPWFGPPMSAASSLTARIMETWAHTQDIADALGVTREPTSRLRHVAHIGVGARAFSYAVHGQALPGTPVLVELEGPDGTPWTWGPPGATDRVSGPALDFCLLVTQRRHRDDLALVIEGPAATEWMSIAQAFAGAAGTGRKPAHD